jgi:hypothetical protein
MGKRPCTRVIHGAGLEAFAGDVQDDRPALHVVSDIFEVNIQGFESGPMNDPRTWTLAHWNLGKWRLRKITTSDNNYDMGSLYIDNSNWQIYGPTETGPQPYNPGGEMALWESRNNGETWKKTKQLTRHSKRNHTYARASVNAHPDFYALWADGHGRQPSESNLYFCDRDGRVYLLPRRMSEQFAKPTLIDPGASANAIKVNR